MIDKNLCRLVKTLVIAAAFLGLAPSTLTLMAQQTSLQIVSPTDGSLVSPGQTISVSVTSPAGISFTRVTVVGEQPIWLSGVATSVPAQFSVVIPQGISPGAYLLTAMGTTSAGTLVESDPIEVMVERSDLPTSIKTQPSRFIFQVAGQQSSLGVTATFLDGSVSDVTSSSHTAFVSSNPAVTTVDSRGIATAVATGKGYITVTYSLGSQSQHLLVPVVVLPPVLSSSPSTLSFGAQNIGTSSSPQTLTISNISNNQGLTISHAASLGDFSATDNCVTPTPLAVGNACTVHVVFTPTGAGARAGAISISNSLTTVPFAIPLTGTGTAAVSCVSDLNGRGTPSGSAPARIDVTWTGIPSAVSYNVLRGTVSGGPYTLLRNAVLPACSDTNDLVNGGTYYYVVQPINCAIGAICQSNEAAIAIPNKPR